MKLGLMLAITVSLCASVSVAAQANECCNNATSVGTAAGSTAVAGAARDNEQPWLSPSVNERLAELESILEKSQITGQMSEQQADSFRVILNQIAEEKSQYQACINNLQPGFALNKWEQLRLQRAIDRLEKSILLSLGDRRAVLQDLGREENDLAHQICGAQAEGRLSADDAKTLKQRWFEMEQLEGQLQNNAHLSLVDSFVIAFRYDELRKAFANALTDRSCAMPDLTASQSDTSKLLAASHDKAATNTTLSNIYDGIVAASLKTKTISDPWQRCEEVLRIAAQYDLLKDKLQLAASGKHCAIAASDAAKILNQRIAQSLIAGKITPQRAQEFLAELNGISAEPASESATANGGSDRSALESSRLVDRIERAELKRSADWQGLASIARALTERSNAAKASNRISAEQASQVQETCSKVMEAAAAKGHDISAEDALALCMQLNTVQVDFDQMLADRAVQAPDLVALQKQLDQAIVDGVENKGLIADKSVEEMAARAEALEANYKKTPAGFDTRARLVVAETIESALETIERRLAHTSATPGGVDQRINRIRERIAAAVADGMMTIDRAKQYRDGLDTIVTQIYGEKTTPTQIVAASQDVDCLTTQFDQELRDRAVQLGELTEQLSQTKIAICFALANGRITQGEAESYMAALNEEQQAYQIDIREAGGISHGEALATLVRIEGIRCSLLKTLRPQPLPPADVARQIANIERAAANAVVTGRLTVPQALHFRQMLDAMAMAAAVNRVGSDLNYAKSLAAVRSLNLIAAEIVEDSKSASNCTDIDKRQSQLALAIKNALLRHLITTKQADDLDQQLDRISLSEAAFRTSDESLSLAEAVTIAQDEERLSERIDAFGKSQVTLRPKR